MSELLDALHGLGLKMGGRYARRSFTDPETGEDKWATLYVGWTTDEAKAEAARELGVTSITHYTAHDPAYSGWEIALRVVA